MKNALNGSKSVFLRIGDRKVNSEIKEGQEFLSIDSDFDLLAYLSAALRAKVLIIVVAIIGGLSALIYSYQLPEVFETVVRTSLVDMEDPGGVSPDNRRASEVITLVEHGFVLGSTKDNYLQIILAKLKSRQFSQRFIEQHNVYRAIFPQNWNDSSNDWTDGFRPDRGTAMKSFQSDIRFVDHNPENDIVSIRFRGTDAVAIRDWANGYVADFNQYMREQALADVAAKKKFLESELETTQVVDIRQSIYRLIEAQTAVAMLASAREEYVLEVIDPAILPFERISPSRKLFLVGGGLAGFLIAIFAVFARVFIQNLIHTINQYQMFPKTHSLGEQS